MIIKGRVSKILPDNLAEITLINSHGHSCVTCHGCLQAMANNEVKTVQVVNSFNRRAGDEVELEIPTGHYYKALFFLLFLPLLGLFLTLIILQTLHVEQTISLLAAFVVFIGSYYFAKKYDQRLKEQQVYKMIK